MHLSHLSLRSTTKKSRCGIKLENSFSSVKLYPTLRTMSAKYVWEIACRVRMVTCWHVCVCFACVYSVSATVWLWDLRRGVDHVWHAAGQTGRLRLDPVVRPHTVPTDWSQHSVQRSVLYVHRSEQSASERRQSKVWYYFTWVQCNI